MIQKEGYKYTDVGLIPEDWNIVALGNLGKFSKGKGILKEQVIEKGYPCIRYGEIYTTHDFVIKEFKSFIDDTVAKESQEIKNGDILFAGSGETIEEIGKSVAYIGNEKAYAGGDVIILSTNNDVNAIYISYSLETDFARKQKRKLGQGHSIVHIYPSDLSKLKILLPTFNERQKIIELLILWDKAIETLQQLIIKKQEQKKGLMQWLLSGKKRVRGFEETHWEKKKLGDCFEYIKSYSISREGLTRMETDDFIYCIHYGDIHAFYENDFLDFSNQNSIPQILSGRDTVNEKDFLKEGDIIMADASEDYEGVGEAVEVINLKNKIAVGGLHTIVLRDKLNLTATRFRAYLFASEYVRNKLRKKATGTSVYSVTKSTLQSILLKVPSLEEQSIIANILQTADKEIELLKNKLEKVKEQKKGLMQVLLTGKKRLNYNV